MSSKLTLGLIGDFDAAAPSHRATNAAIAHAAAAMGVEVETRWIGTEAWVDEARLGELEAFNGLWATPGSPYRSLEGALGAIRYARERGLPFTGT
jgi:CTP synthase (UTP-ammonia lyase)